MRQSPVNVLSEQGLAGHLDFAAGLAHLGTVTGSFMEEYQLY